MVYLFFFCFFFFKQKTAYEMRISDWSSDVCSSDLQDHALLLMGLSVRVGLAHDEQELAVGMRGVGDEPLATVDHVVVAVATDQRLDVCSDGRRHVRFGHGEGRADLTFEQRREPALTLWGRGGHVQHLHVAGVWRAAGQQIEKAAWRA